MLTDSYKLRSLDKQSSVWLKYVRVEVWFTVSWCGAVVSLATVYMAAAARPVCGRQGCGIEGACFRLTGVPTRRLLMRQMGSRKW